MKRLVATLTCMLSLTGAAHADELKRYAYSWPLVLDGDSAAWQVELPIEVYQSVTDAQLRDVVVVDSQGNAVPTAPRQPESATTVSARTELPLFALPAGTPANAGDGPLNLRIERDADGRLRGIDADLGAANAKAGATEDYLIDASRLDAPIDSLRLDWNDAGPIDAQFALGASDDLQNWRSVADKASVLSLAQNGNRLELHEINVAGTHAKYLRLRRLDHGIALPGLRVSVVTSAERSPVRAAREWLGLVPKDPNAPGTPTPSGGVEYRYILPAALPIEAIKLDLVADNSVARVSISSRRAGTEAWTPRGDFTAFRLQQGGETTLNDEMTLPGTARDNEWRVQSATPLNHAPTLNLAWRRDRFVFLGEGHSRYFLVAGSATARRADYPVDVALAQLRNKLGADWQPPLAVVSARETLAGDAVLKLPTPPSKYDWKTFLLWGVLVVAAGGIGYLALSLLRGQKSS